METHSSFPAKTELTKLCFVGTTGEYKPAFFAPVKYYEDGTTSMHVWSDGYNTAYTDMEYDIKLDNGEIKLLFDNGSGNKEEVEQKFGSDKIVFFGM